MVVVCAGAEETAGDACPLIILPETCLRREAAFFALALGQPWEVKRVPILSHGLLVESGSALLGRAVL